MATREQIKYGNQVRSYIKEASKALQTLTELTLSDMSEKMIDDIMKNKRKLSSSKAYLATDNVKAKGVAAYSKQLKELMAEIVDESWMMVSNYVGIKSPIKFASEFEKLPKSVRDRIKKTSDLLIGSQVADLEKNIFFTYDDAIFADLPDKEIISRLEENSEKFYTGASVSSGSAKVAATYINESMNAYYALEVVKDELAAFLYYNPNPKSAICKNLAGQYFPVGDPNMERFTPPNHWNCYDDKTEVYTKEGWKLFKNLHINDKFLSLNPETLGLEWTEAIAVTETRHDGKMIHMTNGQGTVDLMVTPDHPIVGMKRVDRGKPGRELEFFADYSVDKFKSSPEYRLFCSSEWKGNQGNGDMAELIGWYLSEGGSRPEKTYVQIHQHKEHCRKMIKSLLERMGIEFREWETSYAIFDNKLVEYFKTIPKQEIRVVPQWIMESNSVVIQRFLDGFIAGDGHIGKQETKYGFISRTRSYSSSSERMIEQIGELILKIGKAPSFSFRGTKGKSQKFKNGTYIIKTNMYSVRETKSKCKRPNRFEEVDYNGFVYDVSLVKNQTLWVRRNGKTTWGSNCKSTMLPVLKGQLPKNAEVIKLNPSKTARKSVQFSSELNMDSFLKLGLAELNEVK
jgi:hypothetical protein